MKIPFFNKNLEETQKDFVIISNPRIGDNLLTYTLIDNIKRLYKNSKVVFITESKNNIDLLKCLGNIDDIYLWDRKGKHKGYKGIWNFIKDFPYKKIYAVFPLYNYDRLVIFAHLLRPKYVVTTSEKFISTILMKNRFFLRHKEENVQLKNLNLLKGITKQPLVNCPIKLNIPDLETNVTALADNLSKYITLCPISSRIEKDIPFDVIEKLITNSKEKIVLLGTGKQAMELSQYLLDKNLDNYIDLLNKTSLLEACYIIKNALGVISADTGLLHMACALDKPIIELIYDSAYQKSYLPDEELYNVRVLFGELNAQSILSKLNSINTKEPA